MVTTKRGGWWGKDGEQEEEMSCSKREKAEWMEVKGKRMKASIRSADCGLEPLSGEIWHERATDERSEKRKREKNEGEAERQSVTDEQGN